jgi:hypothetical protein
LIGLISLSNRSTLPHATSLGFGNPETIPAWELSSSGFLVPQEPFPIARRFSTTGSQPVLGAAEVHWIIIPSDGFDLRHELDHDTRSESILVFRSSAESA